MKWKVCDVSVTTKLPMLKLIMQKATNSFSWQYRLAQKVKYERLCLMVKNFYSYTWGNKHFSILTICLHDQYFLIKPSLFIFHRSSSGQRPCYKDHNFGVPDLSQTYCTQDFMSMKAFLSMSLLREAQWLLQTDFKWKRWKWVDKLDFVEHPYNVNDQIFPSYRTYQSMDGFLK